MEWLKQGIIIVLKETHLGYKKIANFEEYCKSDDLYLCYNSDGIHSGYLYNDIDWEETAKLNKIPYDSRPTLEEVAKGINTVFINKYEDLPSLEELVKDCHISEFMKTVQLMAKEKIKNNDDVYLVSYYVDLYKFIEDLKHSYMNR